MSNNYIISGPSLHKPIIEESVGQQIYNSLLKKSKHDIDAFIEVVSSEKLSYKDVLLHTTRLANALKNAGFRKNDIISICSENSNHFFIPVFSALYLSMIVAPINNTYKEGELTHALNISKPKIVFCSHNALQQLLNLKKSCSYIKRIIVLDFSDEDNSLKTFIDTYCEKDFDPYIFKPAIVSKEQTVAILCSSGTTGLPKGVVLTNKNINAYIINRCDPRLELLELNKESNFVLGMLPFYHCYGFFINMEYIISNYTIIVISRFEEEIFYNCIEKYKIAQLIIVPAIVTLLAKSPLVDKYNLSSIRDIISGSAPLSENIENEIMKRFPNITHIRQGYGLTETTVTVFLMPLDSRRPGSCGKVIPGISVKICDPGNGESLGPNIVGEICIKGNNVMKEYYNNSEETKKSINEDGWLFTGDLAYFDEDCFFYIVARLKELIKYKGFQVPPAELEAVLCTHPRIKDAGVVGLPDKDAGELPMAFIVKNDEISREEIIKFVADTVSFAKHLRGGVRFVNRIPRNASGKLLRNELKKMI